MTSIPSSHGGALFYGPHGIMTSMATMTATTTTTATTRKRRRRRMGAHCRLTLSHRIIIFVICSAAPFFTPSATMTSSIDASRAHQRSSASGDDRRTTSAKSRELKAEPLKSIPKWSTRIINGFEVRFDHFSVFAPSRRYSKNFLAWPVGSSPSSHFSVA